VAQGEQGQGIAFHGTGLDFNDFTIEKSDGEHGSGFYFDSTQEIAEGNSGLDDGSKGSVVPAYLSVKKPAIYSGSGQTVWGERSHPKAPKIVERIGKDPTVKQIAKHVYDTTEKDQLERQPHKAIGQIPRGGQGCY
jgi:hypothetical protein